MIKTIEQINAAVVGNPYYGRVAIGESARRGGNGGTARHLMRVVACGTYAACSGNLRGLAEVPGDTDTITCERCARLAAKF